jgi:hypothetical protein
MKHILEVCLAAVALATAASPAESSSFAGTWEGRLEGVKAVTLEIQDVGPIVTGGVTFYVIKDEGEGKRIGGATHLAMEHVRWHDDTLEFEVTIPTAGDVVHFRMILNGRNTAKLKRFAGENLPESSISLRRQVQL